MYSYSTYIFTRAILHGGMKLQHNLTYIRRIVLHIRIGLVRERGKYQLKIALSETE